VWQWLESILRTLSMSPTPTTDDDLARAGELAVAEAERFWSLNIFDPKRTDTSEAAKRSRFQIDEMIRRCGWTWEIPYAGDGQLEWCGLFVGACWAKAGITKPMLKTFFASTYRLDRWARHQAFNGATNPVTDPPRLIVDLNEQTTALPWEPRAGDILMIGPGKPAYGSHICLVKSFNGRDFETVEGNGIGDGPKGKQQGVVHGTRHLGGAGWCARRLIRPSVADLV
jgi:hypothetical protein